jgi:hypothetical protein
VLLAEKTGDALQVVLDTLAPAERAAFVLHDVFGFPFDEISAVMGRSGSAVRQLASRARRKVQVGPEPASSRAARARQPTSRRRVPGCSPRWGSGRPVDTPGARCRHACRQGRTTVGHGSPA